ncbi:helix-turn-helix transcriptional regulator [Neorhizobium galegae]|uniref:helix-turn-helix domain-containing protein n=1 Tax=Neorhizobium TaxID=1525371 RepID=UPI000CF97303|nr:helix-turn-helix transcriptional regulator [Neorhizobium tomejilense]MCQ1779129.1 helix-turn-helix transcriptional regulator [Neorhizobium galegae]MCQ1799196.1 helix-turn-helix transcriptional regulator [Neorhizobium galegae]
MEKTLTTKGHSALVKLVREKREAAGLTQEVLAKTLGEHQSFIARLESGQRRIDVLEYVTLAEVIGFDAVDELSKLIASADMTLVDHRT